MVHFFFTLLISLSLQASTPINAIVGEVEGQFVTAREVKISHVIEGVLLSLNSRFQREKWILKMGTSEFVKSAEDVLLDHTLLRESENFSLGNVKKQEIQKVYNQLASSVKGWSYWRDLQVSRSELMSMIGRKLKSKKFIDFRVRSTVVAVTDIEARSYYERNKKKFGSVPFTALKKNISLFLSRRNSQRRLNDWLSVLRRKYRVRTLVTQ